RRGDARAAVDVPAAVLAGIAHDARIGICDGRDVVDRSIRAACVGLPRRLLEIRAATRSRAGPYGRRGERTVGVLDEADTPDRDDAWDRRREADAVTVVAASRYDSDTGMNPVRRIADRSNFGCRVTVADR